MKGTDLYKQGPHGATIDPGSDVRTHFPSGDDNQALYKLNKLTPYQHAIISVDRKVQLAEAIKLVSDSVDVARKTTTVTNPDILARAERAITKSRDCLRIVSQYRIGAQFENKGTSLNDIKGNRIWVSRLVVDTKDILDLDGVNKLSTYSDYNIDKTVLSKLPPDPENPDAKDPFTQEHRRALNNWSRTGFPPKRNGPVVTHMEVIKAFNAASSRIATSGGC
jgi:hypothetical protein